MAPELQRGYESKQESSVEEAYTASLEAGIIPREADTFSCGSPKPLFNMCLVLRKPPQEHSPTLLCPPSAGIEGVALSSVRADEPGTTAWALKGAKYGRLWAGRTAVVPLLQGSQVAAWLLWNVESSPEPAEAWYQGWPGELYHCQDGPSNMLQHGGRRAGGGGDARLLF